MKRFDWPLALGGAAFLAMAMAPACFGKKEARTALDVAEVICVVANATRAPKDILEACKLEQELAPAVERILASNPSACAVPGAPSAVAPSVVVSAEVAPAMHAPAKK